MDTASTGNLLEVNGAKIYHEEIAGRCGIHSHLSLSVDVGSFEALLVKRT